MFKLKNISENRYNNSGYQPINSSLKYVPFKYNITYPVDNGILIYNVFTCELLYLQISEYTNWYNSSEFLEQEEYKYLISHWFLMPEDLDQYSFIYAQKENYRYRNRAKSFDKINSYAIFTTTNCNANCYYCYEADLVKRDMSDEVASDIVDFIKNNSTSTVHLQWYGGEPLCNINAINKIVYGLNKNKIQFDSKMISNGYLLKDIDPVILHDAWKLKKIQITLDGTQEIYNQVKDYNVTDDDNPFETVLNNIKNMLDNDIEIIVRLNISDSNKDDLLELVDILFDRFKDYSNFSCYSHILFLSDSEIADLYNSYKEIQNKIISLGGKNNNSLEYVKVTHCMADNKHSLVITPEGNLTLCEHYCDAEVIGSIYDFKNVDKNKIAEWSVQKMGSDCKDCLLFPRCTKLFKCPVDSCLTVECDYKISNIKKMMKAVYDAAIDSIDKNTENIDSTSTESTDSTES